MRKKLFLLLILFVAACGPDKDPKNLVEPSDEIYLSIDAGTMLGMIPLMLLEDIEKQTGKNIYQLVNGVMGTSTGAIIGGLLTLPLPINGGKPASATRGLGFYKEAKLNAFKDANFGNWSKVKELMEKELQNTFGTVFQSKALIPLQIATYELTKDNQGIFIFDSEKAKQDTKLDVEAALAIRASTAFVPIFGQAIFAFNGLERTFIDLANGQSAGLPAELRTVDPSNLLYESLKDKLPKDKKVTIYALGTGLEPGTNETYIRWMKEGGTITIVRLNPDLSALHAKIFKVLDRDNIAANNNMNKEEKEKKMKKIDGNVREFMNFAINTIPLEPGKEAEFNSIDAIQAAGDALKSTPAYHNMLEDMMARAKIAH